MWSLYALLSRTDDEWTEADLCRPPTGQGGSSWRWMILQSPSLDTIYFKKVCKSSETSEHRRINLRWNTESRPQAFWARSQFGLLTPLRFQHFLRDPFLHQDGYFLHGKEKGGCARTVMPTVVQWNAKETQHKKIALRPTMGDPDQICKQAFYSFSTKSIHKSRIGEFCWQDAGLDSFVTNRIVSQCVVQKKTEKAPTHSVCSLFALSAVSFPIDNTFSQIVQKDKSFLANEHDLRGMLINIDWMGSTNAPESIHKRQTEHRPWVKQTRRGRAISKSSCGAWCSALTCYRAFGGFGDTGHKDAFLFNFLSANVWSWSNDDEVWAANNKPICTLYFQLISQLLGYKLPRNGRHLGWMF